MFGRTISGGDNSQDTMSQIRSLLNGGSLLGSTRGGGAAAPLGSLNLNSSINLHGHLAGPPLAGTSNSATTAAAISPYLTLLLKQALNSNNNSPCPSSSNNNGNANMTRPTIDLLLARQKLLQGGNAQNGMNLLSQASLSNLANVVSRAEPALVSRTNSSSSSCSSSVSQAIRKRTSGRFPGLSDRATGGNLSNKRRRLAHASSKDWTPSCSAGDKDATFRLPRRTGDGEKNPFQQHPLKSFRAKWDNLDKKVSSLKFQTKAEKAAFMREMFSRSLRDGCLKPSSGVRKQG